MSTFGISKTKQSSTGPTQHNTGHGKREWTYDFAVHLCDVRIGLFVLHQDVVAGREIVETLGDVPVDVHHGPANRCCDVVFRVWITLCNTIFVPGKSVLFFNLIGSETMKNATFVIQTLVLRLLELRFSFKKAIFGDFQQFVNDAKQIIFLLSLYFCICFG